VLIAVIGLALAFLWFVPWWVDNRRAYRLRQQTVHLVGGRLLEAASKDGLKLTELEALLATLGDVAISERETARAVMSFMLINVVGIALGALLLSSASDAGDLRKTVIASILTLLGTIVGFYFGTRAAETGGGQAPPPPVAAATTPPAVGGAEAAAAEAAAAAGAAEVAAAAAEEAAAPTPCTEGEPPPAAANETPPTAEKEPPPPAE
jgi:hypothetical protein